MNVFNTVSAQYRQTPFAMGAVPQLLLDREQSEELLTAAMQHYYGDMFKAVTREPSPPFADTTIDE